jgi:hypothetical protein
MPENRIKDLKGHLDDSYIIGHYQVSYDLTSDDRYKHIDELLLYDKKLIKATMGPIDLNFEAQDFIRPMYIVPEERENRIDLIALEYYGASKFWWVIAYANRLEDPFDLPKGKILIIPSLKGIRDFPNPLN